MKSAQLLRDRRGVGAVEFALAAPVFLGMVFGVTQLGTLYFANAGLKHSVDEAARKAVVFPAPNDETILAAFDAARFGMKGELVPEIVRGTSEDGMETMDISVSYDVPLNFVFFEIEPITLNHSRRLFLQNDLGTPQAGGGTGGGTSGGTSTGTGTSSTGGTTPTPPTPTPPTPTTTSASSTSTGGATSSTSSTSSSSGNASSGNGNGNGNNGGDKDCKKKC